MIISQAGVDLIKTFEGLRLLAYQDDAGVWTIGYGHTEGVKSGDVISEVQAESYLLKDIDEAAQAVLRLTKQGLTQGQFDALVSFVFNLGQGAYARSTLLKTINTGDFEGACFQFSRWVKVRLPSGEMVTSNGLVRRRAAECEMFSRSSSPEYMGGPISPSRVREERDSLKQSRTVKAGGGAVIGAVTAGGTTALSKAEKLTASLSESVDWFDHALAGLYVFGIVLAIGGGIYAIYCRRDDWLKAGK